MKTKQVIVIRKDLNMRKGKMVAQGAHASMAVITKCLTKDRAVWRFWPSEEITFWLEDSFTKICVSVDSEEELFEIYKQADLAELPCSIIQDSGKTEFKEPTYTAVAVGPGEIHRVDKVTGELKLL